MLDPPLRALQRATGQGGMIAFFLAPNMAIFGIFVLVPLFVNFAYSATGGTALFLPDRAWVGGQHMSPARLRRLHRPARAATTSSGSRSGTPRGSSCAGRADDRHRDGHGADPQPRDSRARLLARRVLLPGAAVAGGGRADLALDPAAPGAAELAVDALGGETVNWLTERSYAFAAAVGVSVWAHMGFYALILLAGLQAIPRDLYEAAEMDGTPPRAFLAHHPAAPDPEPARRHRARADPGGAGLRRGLRAHRRRPGHSTLFLTQYIYEMGFASLLHNPGLGGGGLDPDGRECWWC